MGSLGQPQASNMIFNDGLFCCSKRLQKKKHRICQSRLLEKDFFICPPSILFICPKFHHVPIFKKNGTSSANGLCEIGGLGPGGLEIWDHLMEGIVTNRGTRWKNPKPPGPKPIYVWLTSLQVRFFWTRKLKYFFANPLLFRTKNHPYHFQFSKSIHLSPYPEGGQKQFLDLFFCHQGKSPSFTSLWEICFKTNIWTKHFSWPGKHAFLQTFLPQPSSKTATGGLTWCWRLSKTWVFWVLYQYHGPAP